MPYKVFLPFRTIKMKLSTGADLLLPLDDLNTVRVGEKVHQLKGTYAEKFQQKILNQGNAMEVLGNVDTTAFEVKQIAIPFTAAKDGYSFPDFELTFDYLFQALPQGQRAILPALDLECFAEDQENLEKQLKETIQLEFVRSRRLNAVQEILSTAWFQETTVEQQEVIYRFLTPMEIYEAKPEDKKALLPEVARKLTVKHTVTYGRDKEIEEIVLHLRNTFNQNILLVGSSGVGKTALVQEIIKRSKDLDLKIEVWETTASRMIKALTLETGWQDNLSTLCAELANKKAFLFVRNLMELFEVGQYEGNEISMAEYLRTYLSRGEIKMIAECTDEELAKIELRSPNFTNFFHLIKLKTPKEGLEDIILKKITDLTTHKKVHIEQAAVKEVIRMNMRYTPYSGFPGKPIRFIENLITNKAELKNVTRTEVIKAFCEETGMPTFIVDPAIPMNIEEVRAYFQDNIFGQDQAISSVVSTLAAIKTALMRKEKPIASFLFVGPTGVGKTELAKVLANFMFGSRERMIRFDMSEYSNAYAMQRLIGTPNKDGTLTAAVRREPFCVLLFDELEKANPNFYDLLLQILGEGRLTDNAGKLVNFCSTIIIMTSNIGANRTNSVQIGSKDEVQEIHQHYLTAVQKTFRPELFNRIDEVIPFAPLSEESVRFVVNREIKKLQQREGIKFRPLKLTISEDVLAHLANIGYDRKYGARYLQRTVREQLILPVAKLLNKEDYFDRLEVSVSLTEDKKIDIGVEVDPMGFDIYIEELDRIVNTDFASRLRRSIYQLREGVYYVELQNELSILKSQEKSVGKAFWENKVIADRYAYYLETESNINHLTSQIEYLETELSLACMGFTTFQNDLIDQLEIWKGKFFNIKKEIYERIFPKSSTCFMGIYGTELEPILKFYLELFEKKGIEAKVETVWFNDRYFQEAIQHNREHEEFQDPFFKISFNPRVGSDWNAPEPQFVLYGFEFKLKGACSFMYLSPESGIHRWKFSAKEDYRYMVRIAQDAFATPHNINRKDFYRQDTPRRVIDKNHVKDSLLNLNREFQKGQLVNLVTEKLDEVFEVQLNSELL